MTATATAFYNLYNTLPREVKEEVKTLITSEETALKSRESERIKWAAIEARLAPLRKGLPADYRFDREEANER